MKTPLSLLIVFTMMSGPALADVYTVFKGEAHFRSGIRLNLNP